VLVIGRRGCDGAVCCPRPGVFSCGAGWPKGAVPPWPKCLRRRSPGQGWAVLGAWLLSGAPSCDVGRLAAAVGWGMALIAAQPPIVAATEAEVIKIFALATPAARRLDVRRTAML
jgi:hypothetical protein